MIIETMDETHPFSKEELQSIVNELLEENKRISLELKSIKKENGELWQSQRVLREVIIEALSRN